MLAITVVRFANGTGVGTIEAGLVGLVAGAVFFSILALLFATVHAPICVLSSP